ncbi:hypothetical protein FNH05_08540 [Amycolatopsis rhizosphaerae]|uniref:Secreted protein n=1 Tax=Amycolatopsis rhizosphaerae TaxID=2053003 RepID=A0A558D5J0_9PSEU|nr:hypothetical protein [Amycolatopsis rhizosphaerae]TVT56284.1 hypothetical protein FNH05_08540 [Amycolatopsis rhizosphaerae]
MKPSGAFRVLRATAAAVGAVTAAAVLPAANAAPVTGSPAGTAATGNTANTTNTANTAAAQPGGPLLTAKFLVDGTSRIARLGSDLVLRQGTFDAGLYQGDGTTIRIEGDLSLPATPGYFLAFRFMPVTSRVALPQDGKATGTADISGGLLTPKIDVTVRVYLELSEVAEDGQPIAVGPGCRTRSPLVIPMRGQTALTPGAKSTLESTFDIPPFTGCGVGEDLDPLMTGLISGPGNTMKTTLTTVGIG